MGALVQLVGVVVVALGARRTWLEFAPDEGLLDPIARLTYHVRQRLGDRVKRVWSRIRGRPPQHIAGAGAVTISAVAVDARGRVGFAPLPDGTGTQEAIDLLDERTRSLMDRLEAKTAQLDDEIRAIKDGTAALSRLLDTHVVRLDAQGRRAATGGVRLALAGAAMVIIGLGLQVWPG